METVRYSPVTAGGHHSGPEFSIRRESKPKPNKVLANYIEIELGRGMSIERIKSCLVRLGWPGSEIESAINSLKPEPPSREENPSSKEVLVAYIEKEMKIEIPAEKITSSLTQAGWSSDEIANAVVTYNNKIKNRQASQHTQHRLY